MLLTRAPVASGKDRSLSPAAPRLACVKPVASVHPEPGSNSSLLYLVLLFSKIREQNFVCLFCSFTRPKRSYTRDICSIYLSKELTWVIHFIMTLVLLLVYCKSFNVLFCAWFVSQKRCKVKASFSFPQIFKQQNFITFSPIFAIYAINQHFKNML